MEKSKTINIFILVIISLFILFFIELTADPMGPQRNIFFRGLEDLFADFLNLMPLVTSGNFYNDSRFQEFYNIGFGTGFPLGYFVSYFFSQFEDYYFMDIKKMWVSRTAIMSALMFSLIQTAFLHFALNQIIKKYRLNPWILLALFLSGVFLFSIERGNMIVINAALVCYYLCNYDSENKNERLLAGAALALAATFKIYPVLLGFLYFEKRQYREIIFSAVCTLFLIFFPFFLVKNGFSNIPLILNNTQNILKHWGPENSAPRFSIPHLLYVFLRLISNDSESAYHMTQNLQIVITAASVVSIILSLLSENKWIRITLIILVVVFLPVVSAFYCALYLFPVILLYFATLGERHLAFNVFIFLVFVVLLNPFQLSIHIESNSTEYILGNYILSNIVLLLLWIVLLIISSVKIIGRLKPVKKA